MVRSRTLASNPALPFAVGPSYSSGTTARKSLSPANCRQGTGIDALGKVDLPTANQKLPLMKFAHFSHIWAFRKIVIDLSSPRSC